LWIWWLDPIAEAAELPDYSGSQSQTSLKQAIHILRTRFPHPSAPKSGAPQVIRTDLATQAMRNGLAQTDTIKHTPESGAASLAGYGDALRLVILPGETLVTDLAIPRSPPCAPPPWSGQIFGFAPSRRIFTSEFTYESRARSQT